MSIRWLRVRVRVRVRVRLPNLEHQVAARVRPAVAGGRAWWEIQARCRRDTGEIWGRP